MLPGPLLLLSPPREAELLSAGSCTWTLGFLETPAGATIKPTTQFNSAALLAGLEGWLAPCQAPGLSWGCNTPCELLKCVRVEQCGSQGGLEATARFLIPRGHRIPVTELLPGLQSRACRPQWGPQADSTWSTRAFVFVLIALVAHVEKLEDFKQKSRFPTTLINGKIQHLHVHFAKGQSGASGAES